MDEIEILVGLGFSVDDADLIIMGNESQVYKKAMELFGETAKRA